MYELLNVKCNDEKSYNRLLHYIATIGDYKNFDESMMCNVYVDGDNDLIGFESQKYRIQYVNNTHKLSEIAKDTTVISAVPFNVLKYHLLHIK